MRKKKEKEENVEKEKEENVEKGWKNKLEDEDCVGLKSHEEEEYKVRK